MQILRRGERRGPRDRSTTRRAVRQEISKWLLEFARVRVSRATSRRSHVGRPHDSSGSPRDGTVRRGRGGQWILLSEFVYEVGEKGSGDVINVNIGFHTDFASIPRPLWVFLPRWGKYGNAAVIHDYLYWEQPRSRKDSDDILLEGRRA